MKLAVFADVHGNLQALRAALADVDAQSPDEVLCLGDLVGYGANPNEVIAEIRGRGIATVMGNYDEGVGFDLEECGCAYAAESDRRLGDASLRWSRAATTDENKTFLRELPAEIRRAVDGVRMLFVHGSPRRRNEYLYGDRPERSLARLVELGQCDVLAVGHTHIPWQRKVGDALVVNVGSVGKPKHGDPRATYALIALEGGTTAADIRYVPYDVEGAARAVLAAAGLPGEFAAQLRGDDDGVTG
jgi:putative phosphoesterase